MQQWIIRKGGSDRRMRVETISVSVSVCLWDMCSLLLLQKGKHQLHSPAWAETPGWTKAVLGWRRWPCSLPYLHLYTYILSFLFSFKGGIVQKRHTQKRKVLRIFSSLVCNLFLAEGYTSLSNTFGGSPKHMLKCYL